MLRQLLNMLYLRVKFDAELSADGLDYTLFESYDLLRIGITGVIHDHQRLLVVDCSIAASLAFPATLFDHPCGRNFNCTVRQVIMWDFIVRTMLCFCGCFDAGEMLSA